MWAVKVNSRDLIKHTNFQGNGNKLEIAMKRLWYGGFGIANVNEKAKKDNKRSV